MFSAIEDEKVIRRSKDAKDLAKLVGDGIKVTDQDEIIHTIKTIDEAIALIEEGKNRHLLQLRKRIVQPITLRGLWHPGTTNQHR